MLHTAKPTPYGESALEGVIHVDHTVRYQTVSDGPYAELLRQLKAIGHPPAIVNTSLNAHSKPMCHTQAMLYRLQKSMDQMQWSLVMKFI